MGVVLGKIGVETPRYSVLRKTDTYEVRVYEPLVAAEVHSSELYNGKGGRSEQQQQQQQQQQEEATTSGGGGKGKGERNFNADAFRVLAQYIGVFSEPANRKASSGGGDSSSKAGEKIAMTAPVATEPERVAMTAPVTNRPESMGSTVTRGESGKTMAFYLPSKYKRVEDAPAPTDARVHLRQIPQRVAAALTFRGTTDMKRCQPRVQKLLQALGHDDVRVKLARDGERAVPAGEVTSEGVKWTLARYNPPFSLPQKKTNEVIVELDESAWREQIPGSSTQA